MFSDFEKYENISDEWEPPTEEPYASQGNRKSHLLEPDACDQFGLVHDGGDKVIFASFWAISIQWGAKYRPFEYRKHLGTKFCQVTILNGFGIQIIGLCFVLYIRVSIKILDHYTVGIQLTDLPVTEWSKHVR